MLEYDRVDISEGIDVNKTNLSKECELCTTAFLKMLVLSTRSIFAMVVMI